MVNSNKQTKILYNTDAIGQHFGLEFQFQSKFRDWGIFWKYEKLCNDYVMIENGCIENVKSGVMIGNSYIKIRNEIISSIEIMDGSGIGIEKLASRTHNVK